MQTQRDISSHTRPPLSLISRSTLRAIGETRVYFTEILSSEGNGRELNLRETSWAYRALQEEREGGWGPVEPERYYSVNFSPSLYSTNVRFTSVHSHLHPLIWHLFSSPFRTSRLSIFSQLPTCASLLSWGWPISCQQLPPHSSWVRPKGLLLCSCPRSHELLEGVLLLPGLFSSSF